MSAPWFADSQDLLRQRRLERGLPPDPPAIPSARQLLMLGSLIGGAALGVVLLGCGLILVRNQMVSAEIARMSGVPGLLQGLETELRSEKAKLDQQSRSNQGLAGGLVALSSGSALVYQLGQLTPQGVQITQALVSGTALTLKGRAEEPGALTRVNALSLLLSYSPLFRPDDVRVIKLSREAAGNTKGAPPPGMAWELTAALAPLQPSQQLTLLRKLGADGMAARLQDLARTGVLP